MVDVNELTFWFYVQNHGFIDSVQAFATKHQKTFVETEDGGYSLEASKLHDEFKTEFEGKVSCSTVFRFCCWLRCFSLCWVVRLDT